MALETRSIPLTEALQRAIDTRASLGLFENTECLRLFYGPGESKHPSLQHIAVDLFCNQLWVTQWTKVSDQFLKDFKGAIADIKLPRDLKIKGATLMDRAKVASDENSAPFFGNPSSSKFTCTEFGAKYHIQMLNTKHPGLFLDHAPLRLWLLKTQTNKRVLNLFSYTGSLSVAAGLGGASKVTTLDLSKATIEWAQDNWRLNELAEDKSDFIYGDAFEWLPKFSKRGDQYETIISDPPSFSRSKGGTFSTQKDLVKLHSMLFSILAPGGILITSINSENISEVAFMKEIEAGAKKAKAQFRVLKRVDLPESFPTFDPSLKDRYLKGFYLLRV